MANSLDMLDVLLQADELARDKRKAAQIFLRAVALKAVVDGEDPQRVAMRCGIFRDVDREEQIESNIISTMEDLMARYGLYVTVEDSEYERRSDPMTEFKKLLYKAVDDILKEVS